MSERTKKKNSGIAIALGGVQCEPFDLFLNYRGNRFSLRRQSLQVDSISDGAEGTDSLGAWSEQIVKVLQPAKFAPEQRLIIRRYAELDIAALRLENEIELPMLDTDAVAGISFDLPSAGPGYMTHLFMHEFKSLGPGYFFSTSTFTKRFPENLDGIDWGNFAICQAGGGRYMVMLPTIAHGASARIAVTEGRAGFVSTGLDSSKVYRSIPLGIIATGRDPYQLVKDAFKAAREASGLAFNLREEKPLPDIFKYFGWCSWNAFGQAVKADDLLAMARDMQERSVPVGYFLIDDGWQSVRDAKLTGFDANAEKFPGGLAAVASRLKSEFGVKHVGVWHTLQGYWDGIDASAPDFAANPQWFWFGRNRRHCPNPIDEHGRHFMAEWYRRLRSWGVDFVKVDNQGGFREYFYNMLPQGEAMQKMQANLQNAAKDAGLPIINCMEQHPECYYHYYWSRVGRVNTDFFPEGDEPTKENRDIARRHVQDALYNAFWFQEIVHPDYDMFQTHHSAANCFAALNALSGGPLYTTDVPKKMNLELIRKVTNDDGTLLRADQPGRPCLECITAEPMSGDVPLAAFANVGGSAVVVAMNISDVKKLKAQIKLKGLQLPLAPKYAVYSHFAGTMAIASAGQVLKADLARMQVEVFTVAPVKLRFAPFGLVDRFLSPAGIVSFEHALTTISVELSSPGLFAAYSGTKITGVRCGDHDAALVQGKPHAGQYSLKDGLLLVNTPSKRLTITL